MEHRFRNGFWNSRLCGTALFQEGRGECTEKERFWDSTVVPRRLFSKTRYTRTQLTILYYDEINIRLRFNKFVTQNIYSTYKSAYPAARERSTSDHRRVCRHSYGGSDPQGDAGKEVTREAHTFGCYCGSHHSCPDGYVCASPNMGYGLVHR